MTLRHTRIQNNLMKLGHLFPGNEKGLYIQNPDTIKEKHNKLNYIPIKRISSQKNETQTNTHTQFALHIC